MTIPDRIILLITGVLAAYQIAVGIDGLSIFPTIAYSIAFGVLLVAGLLLLILGLDILDAPVVVIISTIIPISLAAGLVWQYLPSFGVAYFVFSVVGFLAIILTRTILLYKKIPLLVLAIVHGAAGLTIFLLPIILVVTDRVQPGFILVSAGGAFIGLGGILLVLLKAGKPILSRETIFGLLPGLLLLMNLAFVLGFALG